MPTNILKKGVAFGIILLFINLSFSSTSTAIEIQGLPTLNHSCERMPVQVLCYEYKPDGTIKKNVILLPRSEHLKMRQSLLLSTSIEEKLAIYQRYGMIPTNVTIQHMKDDFDQYLNSKNIDVSTIEKYSTFSKTTFRLLPLLIFNINCTIDVYGTYTFHLLLGMSALTRYWNAFYIVPFKIPGIDLCDLWFSVQGAVYIRNGVFPDRSESFLLMSMIVMGFVGYCITGFMIPLPLFDMYSELLGYAVFISAFGQHYQPESLMYSAALMN